jgi:RNA polymerase sigma factor (TIGR02999 family)
MATICTGAAAPSRRGSQRWPRLPRVPPPQPAACRDDSGPPPQPAQDRNDGRDFHGWPAAPARRLQIAIIDTIGCGRRWNKGVRDGILVFMTEVTKILSRIEQGDPSAADQLLPLVYDELRKLASAKLASEKPGQTLQATALVHEAYVRLVDVEQPERWNSRSHFFSAAAEAMRLKRGRGAIRQDIEPDRLLQSEPPDPLEVLAIHESLQRLADKSPRRAELVKLRYFLGFTVAEAAEILGVAPATAEEDWTYAKAWLRRELRRGEKKRFSK